MELQDACARLHAEHPGSRRWIVAFSGGMDSRVLLDLCHRYLASLAEPPLLEALHIDHGIHPESVAWARHCAETCKALGLRLHLRRLQAPGQSEDALRRARYAIFEEIGVAADLLLLAHHRDDQAETVLLRLLRGAGPAGLAGMPASRPCGAARLCRPLLELPRERLRTYAVDAGLAWVEDPANTSPRFGRNVIRHELMPRIEQRWPGASGRIARAALHCAEAEDVCRERAEEDLQLCLRRDRLGLECLGIREWRSLPTPRQGPALRLWFRERTGRELETAALHRLRSELIEAAADRQPAHVLGAWRLRRHAGCLYLGAELAKPPSAKLPIAAGEVCRLPGVGEIRLESRGTAVVRASPGFSAGFPRPGMRCRLAGRPEKSLRHVMAEAGVPAWLRDRVPLLFCGEALMAVAACGATQGHAPASGGPEETLRFCWIPDGAQGESAHPGVALGV